MPQFDPRTAPAHHAPALLGVFALGLSAVVGVGVAASWLAPAISGAQQFAGDPEGSPAEQREIARGLVREKKLEDAYNQWSQDVRGRAYVELREAPR